MAFLRRRLAKLMEKDATPPSLTLTRADGSVLFTRKELQRYTWLLAMIDADADEQVGGAEGAAFLKRSGLSTEQLREVWRCASGGTSKPRLSKEDWFLACKLVAAVQYKGVEPSMSAVVGAESLPPADFHYNLAAEINLEALPEIAEASIKVVVNNPTTFGSGLSKHTRYNVTTTTSLPHFPRKDMSVWRRYSDFEWLHKRLSLTFPAAIIPLFPEKRVLGNTDETFVRDRMLALEAYTDKVAHHPALSTSLDLLVFLDATDAGLEAARSFIEAVESEEAESVLSKGVDMVAAVVSRETIPPVQIKVDDAFVEACSQHGAALARLSHAARAGEAVSASQRGIADTMVGLSHALAALADHERKHAAAGTSAASAVASAAVAAKRAETALFSGSSTTAAAPASSDSAAAAAFASHSAAANTDTGSISAMFQTNFDDPYAAFHLRTPGASVKSAVTSPGHADVLADLLTRVAETLTSASTRTHAHITQVDELLLKHFKQERDKEAELGEAIKRRDASIDLLQEANASLHRKKRAEASLKPTSADYAKKSGEARIAVEKAEKQLAERKENVERLTDKLKAEMQRTNKARRIAEVKLLAESVRTQGANATERAELWFAALPVISDSDAATEASAETVAAVARKAEAKARAASQARAAKTGTAGGSVLPPGGGAAGAAATDSGVAAAQAAAHASAPPAMDAAMPVFAEAVPMPTAADL